MDIFQLYKPLRNKVTQLARDDTLRVIWAYSQYLQIKGFQMPMGIEVHRDFLLKYKQQEWIAEWSLELLAKEVILNAGRVAQRGKTLRAWAIFAGLVNELKTLEEGISSLQGPEKIFIELSRIAHRQFVWQENSPNAATTIRCFKIFNTPAINEICISHLGLTVEDVYLCGMMFMGVFLSHPALNIPFDSEVRRLSQEVIRKFLAFTCRTDSELKPLLKAEQRYDSTFVYAYNSLRAFPLVRMHSDGRETITCPLPTLLFWRITGGLYYEFLIDKRFSLAFGESFQTYVGQVLERGCPNNKLRIFSATTYGTRKERKESVDWIISDESAAIFIECKAKRLSWNAKVALDDLTPLETDIGFMADAIVQIYKTITDYEAGQYTGFPFEPTRKVYPVVATLENWHIFGSVLLAKIEAAVVHKLDAADISRDILKRMPYSVWDIQSLEIGAPIVERVGICRFLDGKLTDSEMNQWEWHAYITSQFREYCPVKPLFGDEYRALFSRYISDPTYNSN